MIIIKSLLGGPLATTSNLTATGSCYTGIENVLDDRFFKGSTTLTSATTMTTADVDYHSNLYYANATQSYIESMSETELNELIEKLENIDNKDKPKTLTKSLNKKEYL